MYKRRLRIFLAIVIAAMATMIGRLGYLQVVRGQEYRSEAERLLTRQELLPAPRGTIYDRTGKCILAVDKPCFDLCLDYRFLVSEPHWMAVQRRNLARENGVPADVAAEIYQQRAQRTWDLVRKAGAEAGVDVEEIVQRVLQRVQSLRQRVGGKIAEEEQWHPIVAGIDTAVDLSGTVGANLQRSTRRHYPYGSTACHVIGLTGMVSRQEQQDRNVGDGADNLARMRVNYLDVDWIGKCGVELLCEEVLRGVRGYRREKATRGGRVTMENVPAKQGGDVHLTIDIELQRALTALLVDGHHNGAIAVLSVPRGEVLALVSAPGYDLNTYRKEFPALQGDKANRPLLDRCVSVRYAPGSTVKPLVGLAGLASGKITVNSTIDCQGLIDPKNTQSFRCWMYKRFGGGHGPLTVTEALKCSCNVFFGRLGGMIGPHELVGWFGQFGLLDRPGTGLSSEVTGDLPGPRDSLVLADGWLMGMGQGAIAVSPLQIANAIATVARGGEFLSPRIVTEGAPLQVRRQLPFTPEQVRAIQRGMWKVVNEEGGTAHKIFQDAKLPVEICGKTGTAEVEGQETDTGWFVGFAPYQDPQIAFAIVLERVEGGGGANAGPVGIELIRMCDEMGYFPKK